MEFAFRLFGIPVRVSLLFFLAAYFLGRNSLARGVGFFTAWVVAMFVGVLLHELGHAITAKAFGQQPSIRLYGFGGVTSYTPRGAVSPGQRMLISLAGPGVGIVLGLAAAVAGVVMTREGGAARAVFDDLVWVNLGWGLINLIPMLPLDGGNIMASLFELLAPGKGQRAARYVSIGMAGLVTLLAVVGRQFIAALFCAFFVYINVQALRTGGAAPAPGREPEPLPPPPEERDDSTPRLG